MPDSVPDRIALVRQALQARGLAACVVLTADPHLSEYLPAHWAVRQWLSGFGGSAGTLVVSAQFAGLWTDSRYWVQAQAELDGTGIALMRAGQPDVPTVAQWLATQLPLESAVGVDGRTLSLTTRKQWLAAFADPGIRLETDFDPVAGRWPGRPALPLAPVTALTPPHACRTRAENLAALRQAMTAQDAQWHWLSALDDIAWLFNLRGADVPYNPVFLAHALVGMRDVRLFVAPGKVPDALRRELAADGIAVQDVAQAYTALADLPAGEGLLVDPVRVTVAALDHAREARIVQAINPSQLHKSRKNAAELNNIRQAMHHDGAALCAFFAWLEAALQRQDANGGQAAVDPSEAGTRTAQAALAPLRGGACGLPEDFDLPDGQITELTVDDVLTRLRSRQPGFISPSFGTIAAFNANAAMPHYQATAHAHAVIQGDGLLLIDSGGQYLTGTTDITRMVAVGAVSDAQKRDCTAVLQGMIALSLLVFPRGISAGALDAVARAPIWRTGADYGHGTGHGVGYCLNVHEGPQSISHRAANLPDTGMQPGMVTSNEPGLYRDGQWGIRIENLVAAVPACDSSEFGEFLAFETLTLCPIDTRCLDLAALAPHERDWLNAYHARVRDSLAPLLDGGARDWLMRRTQPI